MNNKFLLINGSFRKNGTSRSFARTMKSLLEAKGCQVEIVHVMDFFNQKKGVDEYESLLEGFGTIGLFVPMYIDFLPCQDVRLFEMISDNNFNLQGKNLFAVCQYGFPDAALGKPLLESCRIFAESLSMNWLGGMSYGGGAMIDGRNLEDMGKIGEKIIRGFGIACERLVSGDRIPKEAQDTIIFKLPKILYRPMAAYLNRRSRKKAAMRGVKDFYAKPYLD